MYSLLDEAEVTKGTTFASGETAGGDGMCSFLDEVEGGRRGGVRLEARRGDKFGFEKMEAVLTLSNLYPVRMEKIEDLESLPALRRYISDASQLLNKYRNEQKMTNIQREMAVKEEELVKREKAVACREAECTKKEDEQKRKTKSLDMREAALAKQLQQFHTQREKDNKLKKDQMRISVALGILKRHNLIRDLSHDNHINYKFRY